MATSSSLRSNIPAAPAEWGYRMPAEWTPHQGTWLSWPHNPDTWPGSLREVEEFYLELIRHIATDETVFLNVVSEEMRRMVADRLAQVGVTDGVHFSVIPTNDAWCRDYGPSIVCRPSSERELPRRLAVQWNYNAWGAKYPPFDADQGAAIRMSAEVDIPPVGGSLTMEGGAIDVNGEGWLMTTASCLLNPNRNTGVSRTFVEERLRMMLGVREILWLGGELLGDDTDGHIDNLVRFVAPRRVLYVVTDNQDDPQFDSLANNRSCLESWRSSAGDQLEAHPLPVPDPMFHRGQRLPASYANFYLTNRSILVPQFRCRWDEQVCRILAECFPTRSAVPIDCTVAIRGLGGIHCLTQQIPA